MIEIRVIEYKGKQILLQDFSDGGPGEDFNKAAEKAKQLTRSQPPKSVLALFDATGSAFNKETVSA